MNRQTFITYAAAAGNVGLWIMAGILSEGGALNPIVKNAIVTFSASALGVSMALGLVEIAHKMATLPVDITRKVKRKNVTRPNRRYQIARLVLLIIIGGESFLLMPVVVALAGNQSLPAILPGGWLWLWAFGRVAASAALLAGLSAVLESGHKATEAKPKAEPKQTEAAQSKPKADESETQAPASTPAPLYTCSSCSWNSLQAEQSGKDPLKSYNGHMLKHRKGQ
jgi:hypothetical protein